jgi:hypothetical protein
LLVAAAGWLVRPLQGEVQQCWVGRAAAGFFHSRAPSRPLLLGLAARGHPSHGKSCSTCAGTGLSRGSRAAAANAAAASTAWTDSSSKFGKYEYINTNIFGYAAAALCDYRFNYVLAYYESPAEQTRVENGLSLSNGGRSCTWKAAPRLPEAARLPCSC